MLKMLKKLNNKLKKIVSYFFLETKFGIWFFSVMGIFNTIEGVVHLFTAGLGTWGMVDTNTNDVRIWFPIVENIVLGVFSLLTGWALGIKHDHHHH